jgi:hypothetical protein
MDTINRMLEQQRQIAAAYHAQADSGSVVTVTEEGSNWLVNLLGNFYHWMWPDNLAYVIIVIFTLSVLGIVHHMRRKGTLVLRSNGKLHKFFWFFFAPFQLVFKVLWRAAAITVIVVLFLFSVQAFTEEKVLDQRDNVVKQFEELFEIVPGIVYGEPDSTAVVVTSAPDSSSAHVDSTSVLTSASKFFVSLGSRISGDEDDDKPKDGDDNEDEDKPFNKWLLFFQLVIASGIIWLLVRFKEQRLMWVGLGLAFFIFLAFKAGLLSAWAFIQIPYTIGVFIYAFFRTRQAIEDKQWYEVIDHITKKPTKEFSKELPFHTVTAGLWTCTVLSAVFIWKPAWLLMGIQGPLGVTLTALLVISIIWRLFGRLCEAMQPTIYYILGALALGSGMVYIGLPLFVVVLPLLVGFYLLATWLQVTQGRQIVPFRSGKVREDPAYFLWRKETHVAKAGDYPVETGEILRAFRKGDHVWLLAAFLPKQFCQIVIFPMEELSVDPWDLPPLAVGTIQWPESDKLDVGRLLSDISEDPEVQEKKKEKLAWLEELEKTAKRAITEVVWRMGITLFLFKRPGVWLDLSEEDRDPARHQQFIKDRVEEVVDTFANRMTLQQAINVNLLKQDISIMLDGRRWTLIERLEFVFMRDAGHGVHSYIVKDGDQTAEVKAIQQRLLMKDDEIAIETKQLEIATLKGQQASATASEAFRGFAAFVVGKKVNELLPGDLTDEVIKQATTIMTAYRLTEQKEGGGDNTTLLIPSNLAGFLGATLGGGKGGVVSS